MLAVSILLPLASLAAPGGEVVRGDRVAEGALPWMVSVQFGARPGGDPLDSHGCGGELLDETHVLTAAHCVAWPDGRVTAPHRIRVQSGWHVLRAGRGQLTGVSSVAVHPDYYSERGTPLERFDVAMLTLDAPVTGIEFARIPASGDRGWQKPGQTAFVAGWGSTRPYGGEYGQRTRFRRALTAGKLQLIGEGACVGRLGERGIRGLDTNASVCGKPHPGGSCWNDSGGPLYVETGAGTLVIGTLSWGFGCGIRGMPEVYTRLSDPPVASWIEAQLRGG